MDYVKLDGVGSFGTPDAQAWSTALNQTGRPMALELSNSLTIADGATGTFTITVQPDGVTHRDLHAMVTDAWHASQSPVHPRAEVR